ncbi:MAG: substrate-binding domain-containing protein [Planctomycetota bacterium]
MPRRLNLDNRLRQYIHEHCGNDGRVQSEREIAVAMGVSRVAIRAALARMEAAGEVQRIQGKGTYLTELPTNKMPAATVPLKRIAFVYHAYAAAGEMGFNVSVIMGVLSAARHAGCTVEMIPYNNKASLVNVIDHIRHIPDLTGLMGFALIDADLRNALSALNLPAVMVDHYEGEGFLKVLPDEKGMAKMVLDHLRKLGHHRVALTYIRWESVNTERIAELTQQGVDLGLDLPQHRFEVSMTRDQTDFQVGYGMGEKMFAMPERPTACVTLNPTLAPGLIQAAKDFHLQVPRDFSIASIGDTYDRNPDLLRLTTVDLDAYGMGQRSVRALMAGAAQPFRGDIEIRMPGKLIVRNTTWFAPDAPHPEIEPGLPASSASSASSAQQAGATAV